MAIHVIPCAIGTDAFADCIVERAHDLYRIVLVSKTSGLRAAEFTNADFRKLRDAVILLLEHPELSEPSDA